MNEFIVGAQSIIFGLFFMISLVSKFFSYPQFKMAVIQFGIIKKEFVKYFSLFIIFIEGFIAINFSIFIFLDISYIIVCCLMIMFNTAFFYVWYKKESVSCNCFGESEKHTNLIAAILRNIIIFIFSVMGIMADKTINFSLEHLFILLIIITISLLIQLSRTTYKFYNFIKI